ncbi:hypothetical protein [Actinotalea sp.]|uniref:hypothetical protein n=1 Tax=Actinotalea sp. TaxID=1872145 RepID=UPI003562CEE9
MSTIPGESSWTDAGLVPPKDAELPAVEPTDPADLEAVPQAPRPDLRDEATEPDVVDQALEASLDEEAYRET